MEFLLLYFTNHYKCNDIFKYKEQKLLQGRFLHYFITDKFHVFSDNILKACSQNLRWHKPISFKVMMPNKSKVTKQLWSWQWRSNLNMICLPVQHIQWMSDIKWIENSPSDCRLRQSFNSQPCGRVWREAKTREKGTSRGWERENVFSNHVSTCDVKRAAECQWQRHTGPVVWGESGHCERGLGQRWFSGRTEASLYSPRLCLPLHI